MKIVKAKVASLDVWGNKEDGFEVNQSYDIGKTIEFDIDSDQSILQALIDADILSQECTLKDIVIDGDDMIINIDEVESSEGLGMPILNLYILE